MDEYVTTVLDDIETEARLTKKADMSLMVAMAILVDERYERNILSRQEWSRAYFLLDERFGIEHD